jgi:hypothetical protein
MPLWAPDRTFEVVRRRRWTPTVPPAAGPTFVQQATGSSGAGSTTLSAVFGVAPTAGNLLIFQMAGDKNTGPLTLTGWTATYELLNANVSLYLAWKISDGSETTVSPLWDVASTAGNMAWVGEYSDSAAGTWSLLASASNITDGVNTFTWPTGTTAATSADGLGIASAAVDSNTSVTGVDPWGSSYAIRHSSTGGGGRGAIFVAEKLEPASTAATSTFTFTGTADQTSAAIGVWAKVVAGTPPARVPALTSQYGGFY